MITLATEAEKMDDKEKKIATLVTKEEKEQLVPEMLSDLVFLDDVTLLREVATKLKPSGFLLVHASEPVSEEQEGLAMISKKVLGDKTMTLFRQVINKHVSPDSQNY